MEKLDCVDRRVLVLFAVVPIRVIFATYYDLAFFGIQEGWDGAVEEYGDRTQ
jgi:hypothetical protein